MSKNIGLAVGKKWTGEIEENTLLIKALAKHNISAKTVVWSEDVDEIENFDLILIRSCWDYHQHPAQFKRWIKKLTKLSIPIWNPPKVLLWNMNKLYLKELRDIGLPTVPGVFFPENTYADPITVMEHKNWAEVIIKPLIGAGASNLLRLDHSGVEDAKETIRKMSEKTGIIIQPYLKQIEEEGELSLIFFGGEFRYAVRKTPRPGDFRVQVEHGGKLSVVEPNPRWIEQARSYLERITKPFHYLRLDGLVIGDQLRIMEIEALEPSFYFSVYPEGAEMFAEVIRDWLNE